ncbi:hypothetical protein M422DRAFT_60984 [Sphaerobolus stellatus SS14]|uniref:Arf-GAP domain-containing protein n=1 Tax=Sphaerobolus stellatus (strain SS14) TaxID=990650 RepID=A0A0C9VJD1_SPHS4|nr:hypothetical protein M422DRAFT_60984 [Sphaerobolus stellatus SS14]
MTDPETKKILHDLANDDALDNKTCVDCGAPRPQWASISFAVFMCLQCAGLHRGYGVHISFIRSVSMDAWQDEQLRRMKLGGNGPFKRFMREYPAEGGYTEGMSSYDKYHCWAATQYREKLTAELEDKPWSPSPPPPGGSNPNSRPSSAQGLRKSRASARSSSPSPSPLSQSQLGEERKNANENYFASLGSANASRPDNLHPSQGGRYGGFGNTPDPEPVSGGDIQTETVRALSKGWSIFSGAIASVTETVVKPGLERVADPEFREKMGTYVSTASQKAAAAAGTANAWGRQQFGVDVGESVGAVVDKVKTSVVGNRPPEGYAAVGENPWDEPEGSALYQDAGEDDFFSDNGWQDMKKAETPTTTTAAKKGTGEWDEWKDF